MKCKQHYPIIGNWQIVDESAKHTTWMCPKCGEKYTGSKYRGHLEFTSPAIKEARRKHRKELLQPFRQGEVSKEYLDAYPEQRAGMIKEGVITETQAKKAKNVWHDDDVR